MKDVIYILIIITVCSLTGCTKNDLLPDPLNPFPNHGYDDPGLSDDFFNVSASMMNFNNYKTEVQDLDGSITLPVNKILTLTLSETHRKVKNVKWIANGKTIASGNNVEASLSSIGIGNLNVQFTEIESGKKHNKILKLYAFKQVYLSIEMAPQKTVCGEVAIGVTQTLASYNNEKIGTVYLENSIQNICTSGSNKTARIARISISVYDNKTTFSIDVIEPNKINSKNKSGFCLLLFICFGYSSTTTTIVPKQIYGTDSFSPEITKNITPGRYESGNTVLTIE